MKLYNHTVLSPGLEREYTVNTVVVRLASRRRIIPITTPEGQATRALHRAVIGVRVMSKPERPILRFPVDMRGGDNHRLDEVQMPIDQANRLYNFVSRHYINGQQDFNCFTFMRYIAGLGGSSGIYTPYGYGGYAATTISAKPFVPYILRRGEELMHGIIGITDRVCLSVFGDNQPLVLARTVDMARFYAADNILLVTEAFVAS